MRRRVGRTPKTKGRRCRSGKVRFKDHNSAAAALQRITPRDGEKAPVRSYRCHLCSGWHVTSQETSR